MKISSNFSTPNFKSLYIRPDAFEIAAKANNYVGTSEAYQEAEAALEKAAKGLNVDIIIESYGDMGAAIWKGDVPRCDIYKKTEHIVSKENIVEAYEVAAKKLEAEKEKLTPGHIRRERFPGTKTAKKLDTNI